VIGRFQDQCLKVLSHPMQNASIHADLSGARSYATSPIFTFAYWPDSTVIEKPTTTKIFNPWWDAEGAARAPVACGLYARQALGSPPPFPVQNICA